MTENAEKARKFLKELLVLNSKMELNRLDREAVFNKAQQCGSISSEERVQTSPRNDALAMAVAELVLIDDEYAQFAIDYFTIRNEATRILCKMENPTYRKILQMKYLIGLNLRIISEKTHYTYQYTRDCHRLALNEFGKMMEEPTASNN